MSQVSRTTSLPSPPSAPPVNAGRVLPSPCGRVLASSRIADGCAWPGLTKGGKGAGVSAWPQQDQLRRIQANLLISPARWSGLLMPQFLSSYREKRQVGRNHDTDFDGSSVVLHGDALHTAP